MNFADMMEMLRNPQALQARLNDVRERTERITAVGSAGGGMVRITLNGSLDMLACEIAPEAIDPSDPRFLQDLVRAAFNDASAKVKETLQKELASSMDGLPIPPGLFGGGAA
ncbi:MAG: YbaB/EbfC family nucleoid-associated protein [Spirochaetaceae bacterium]|nr:YbaB/EbfC family nucleoid-associated protein [Spirochaetaceae bacterium]